MNTCTVHGAVVMRPIMGPGAPIRPIVCPLCLAGVK